MTEAAFNNSALGNEIRFSPGEVIFRQGDPG